MNKICTLFAFTLALAISASTVFGQQPSPDMSIDSATRSAVIDAVAKELNDYYVFPETAKKMEADLRSRASKGEYDAVSGGQAFAQKLTEDLQSVSHDKHLRVRFSANPIPVRQERNEPTADEKAENIWFNKRLNYGFQKVERLDGNIGYIDLRGFFDPEEGADAVAAAMNFLANTESLIIDLRQNGGGDPAMVALICSYFFGEKPVHLNDLYWRKGDRTDQFWTKPTVAGKKYGNKDVYILTSGRTFSGAEEFSYNMKNLKRATIIGETTGGGAHPGSFVRLGEHFGAFIPSGRAISPITKTNWEGTGVEPDVKVPKEQALKTAYLLALNKSLSAIGNEQAKKGVKDLIEQTKKELDGLKGAVPAK
jgi:C-terminal processing protease CtpA/Prc